MAKGKIADCLGDYKRSQGAYSSSNVTAGVVEEFFRRDRAGQAKYGTTMDRTDLEWYEWLQHLKEELMDAISYIHKLQILERQTEELVVQVLESDGEVLGVEG